MMLHDLVWMALAVAGIGGLGVLWLYTRRLVRRNRVVEEALKERDRLWTGLVTNIPIFVYRCWNDKDWTMQYLSEGCEKVTGHCAADLINNRCLSYNDLIDPDWRDFVWKYVQAHLHETGRWEMDYPIVLPGGSKKWVWEQARGVFDERGELRFIEGVIADITTRKMAEEELAASEERAHRQRAAFMALTLDRPGPKNTDDLLQNVTNVLAEAVQVARASVWWLSEDGATLTCGALYDARRKVYASGQVLQASAYPRYFQAVRAEGRVCAHDARNDDRTSEFADDYLMPQGITSMLDAGLVVDGSLRGVICLEHVGPVRHWMADEEGFLSTIAASVGQYIATAARLKAEHQLASRTEEYETLVSMISVGLYILESPEEGNPRMIYTSPRFCEMFDCAPDALAEDATIIYSRIDPDELSRLLIANEEARRSGSPFFWEGRFVVRGERRWLRIQSWPKRLASGKYYWFGLIEDVTAQREVDAERADLLKKAEESRRVLLSVLDDEKRSQVERTRLTMAIEQAAETVVITDVEGHIQYVNPAFEAVTGYTREEAMGRNPRILKSGEQSEAFYADMWETLAAGKVWIGRLINRRKDGTCFTEDATISPVLNSEGRITNYVAVKRDITKELQVEQQLMQSQKMEVLGRLAGGVAHDFNNLLQSIMGFTELALEESRSHATLHEFLLEIQKASQSASGLTRQLLTFSRRQVTAKQPLDVNQLLEQLSKMLTRVLGESIELTIKPEKGLGPVLSDPGQMEQALMNLAVNARDAMPDGGCIEIATSTARFGPRDVSPHTGARPGAFARITFTDTGSGMPPETLRQVFEPFFTTKPPGQGTGLGLPTVYGIVQQHQGWITVQSEVGVGTTFNIYLPFAEEVPDAPAVSAPKTSHDRGRGRGENILLVEDEDAIRHLMARVLRDHGFRVQIAATAEEALAMVEREAEPVDLLFTDIVLPKMSGFDLAERLTEADPDLKILLTSGYTDERARWEQIQNKGWHYLQKPVSRQVLLDALHAVLGNS